MSMIYAMSDIHGCLMEFEEALSLVDLTGDNKLVLMGDYIHGGPYPYGVLKRIMQLERKYGTEKVIVLAGNHEDMAIEGSWPISSDRISEDYDDPDSDNEEPYLLWMQKLRRYYADNKRIFCHAGVDEEAEDLWELGTDDYTFTWKYPAQTGRFYMDIIAGHVGTAEIAEDPRFHDIYFDGESHYYIDGTVLESGVIPVLMVDTEKDKYYQVSETGPWSVLPYDEIE